MIDQIGDLSRILIIGNSGSGKTYLGNKIAKSLAVPILNLDEVFWAPGSFDQKKSPEVAENEVLLFLKINLGSLKAFLVI